MKVVMEIKEMDKAVIVKNSIEGETGASIIRTFAKNLGILAGELLNKSLKEEVKDSMAVKERLAMIYEADFTSSLREALGLKFPEEEKKEEE